jgi:hypothetical protein
VVIAAVLTFVGYTLATAKPTQTYLVAARDIEPNQPLTSAQFMPVNGDLPPEVRRTVFQSFDQVKDAVLLTRLEAGALVTKSDVVSKSAADSRYVVPFNAPGWKLRDVKQGDTVLLVPFAGDRGGSPRRPLPVRILRLDTSTGTNEQTVLAAANSQDEVQGLVDVVKSSDYWIARDTGSAGAGAPGGTPPATGPATGNGPVTSGPATTTDPGASTVPGAPPTTARRP